MPIQMIRSNQCVARLVSQDQASTNTEAEAEQVNFSADFEYWSGTSLNICVLGCVPYFLLTWINIVLGEEAKTIKILKSTFKNYIEPHFEMIFSKIAKIINLEHDINREYDLSEIFEWCFLKVLFKSFSKHPLVLISDHSSLNPRPPKFIDLLDFLLAQKISSSWRNHYCIIQNTSFLDYFVHWSNQTISSK